MTEIRKDKNLFLKVAFVKIDEIYQLYESVFFKQFISETER